MLLGILSSDPNLHYYRMLHDEAEAFFPRTEDWAQSTGLLKLCYMDSTIRESLRRRPILLRGLWREVMPKEGVTLPDGQHLPQGSWVGVPVPGIHNDERFYHEPEVYDPFPICSKRLVECKLSQGRNHGCRKSQAGHVDDDQ
jgi:Cytochrome P450